MVKGAGCPQAATASVSAAARMEAKIHYVTGMQELTPARSRVEMTQIVMPGHTNGVGGVLFGGVVMQWIDVCAGVAAMRHAAGAVVTASIDRMDFLSPIRVGDIVIL